MRVGIVTFHAVNNFGAVLQAYALYSVLRALGCEAEVIDYQPNYLVGHYRRLGYRPTTIFNTAVRRWRFYRFRRSFITTSRRIYRTAEALRTSPPAVDALVCGSDQVWNLKILQRRLDSGFFLDFCSDGVRRIAYAPSLGDMPFPEELQAELARLLGRFDAISTREQAHCGLIRRLAGCEPAHVLDPTLLLEDYSAVVKDPQKAPEHYIAAYPMEYSLGFSECLVRLKALTGMPIVNIGTHSLSCADYNHPRLGPSEWLGWVRKASYVCTNSFHGTAFSIVFRRTFACFAIKGRAGLTARMEDLLNRLGLLDRLIVKPEELSDLSVALDPIAYASIEPTLVRAISESRDYLERSLFGRR